MKYSEEKVKEVLDELIKTSHVQPTNINLQQSNKILGVKFISDKLQYRITFEDNGSTVVKRKWIDDYVDSNDSESKRLIEDALVMRAEFF